MFPFVSQQRFIAVVSPLLFTWLDDTFPRCWPCAQPKEDTMTVTSVQGCYNSVLASVVHTWLLALGGGTTSLFSGGQTAAFLLHSGGVQCEVPHSQSLPTWQRPVPP